MRENRHNSLQSGAGNQYSPAPSFSTLPVYAICSLCGEAEEAEKIRPYATEWFAAHLCPECFAHAEREYMRMHREEDDGVARLSRWGVVIICALAAVLVWRWAH